MLQSFAAVTRNQNIFPLTPLEIKRGEEEKVKKAGGMHFYRMTDNTLLRQVTISLSNQTFRTLS